MQHKTKYNDFDVYTIYAENGVSRACFVPEKGGVVSSIVMPFKDSERELLFQHSHFWEHGNPHLPGGLPFIFPICARLERNGIFGDYLYDGHLYNLPIHGFAPYLPWQCEILAVDKLCLTLLDNAETFAKYPFNFKIELEYQIANDSLICRQTYTNTGTRSMPYYAGFHPYFLTPETQEGKEKVMLNYEPKRRFVYNERLTDIVDEQELFTLPASVADPVINEQLTQLGEDKVISLSYPDGFKLFVEVLGEADSDMFSYVQLYTQKEQPFICVEPWMGFPNALNSVHGSRWLRPHQSEKGILRLRG